MNQQEMLELLRKDVVPALGMADTDREILHIMLEK